MTSSRRRTADRVLKRIRLHAPEYPGQVDLEEVVVFLRGFFPSVSVTVGRPVLAGVKGRRLDAVAETMARARVKDPSSADQSTEPMYGEIEFEKRAARGKARVGGVVYDGRRLEDLFSSLLDDELGIESADVVVTQRLSSTFSRDDLRHHLRTVVCGFPSIVSIPGIVEAPAKPREYHILRQELDAAGAGELEIEKLKSAFKGRFVDYDTPELNEALKGIVLQAIVFHMTLDPFCADPKCRLFNAHWQEELLKSQITEGRVCSKHDKMLRKWREDPSLAW